MPHKAAYNWIEKLSKGCSIVEGDDRNGHPADISTGATVEQAEEMIGVDRTTIDNVATAIGFSHSLAYNLTCLNFRKVCAHRVPRELNPE